MNILVTEIDVEGIDVLEGGEIAVFDGELCVGTAVIGNLEQGSLTSIIATE